MSLPAHFSRTVIPGLLLLTLLHNSLVLSQTSYYVKYNSTENTTATGAIESPFTSVNQAVTKLGAGTFELLLLANPVYTTTNLVFPSNSNYSIRPASLAEGQTHFPFYFNKAIVTQIKQGTVNMQQIQVIDIDTARATNNPLIRVLQGGILNLDRVKFINVNYSTSYNTLLYAVGSLGVAEINMINCEFKNLTNARMQVSAGRIAIVNTIFSDLVLSRTSFIPMTNSPGSNYSLIFKNVTIQNSRFTNVPSGSTYGFAYIYNYSSPNVIFEDFTVKDVNVTNKIAFILLSVSAIGQTTIPLFKSKNVLVQNFYEVNQPDGTSSQLAIYHQIQGNVTLEYTNFTLTNVQLKNSAFIQSFQLATANPVLAPNATLSGVKIQNSTNIYITLKHFNTISCDDFQLLNNAYGTPYVIIGMLVFSESTNTVMTNFRGQNNTGPLLKTTDVFNPTMRNWSLTDVYTSIKWASRYPIFLTRKRDSLSYTTNQAQGDQSAIIMESIMINGYYDINGLTSAGSDTGSYSMGIITEYGKAYLNNSRFYNMKLSCFGGGYTNHLMIDNLTVDSDPSIPFSAIPTRGIFKFTETRELSIINSRFLNQKNMFIMLMYFLHRSDNYEVVTHPILRFENLTVINNTASTSKTNTAYPSLFNIRTPLYPVTATFKDSFFQGNTVLSAIIMTDESIKIDVDIINNTFVDNYALQESGVISAKSMRGNVSNINLINNTFGNNTSLKYGGVLYFLSTQHNIVSMNNNYYNNSAGISGGVGYFSHADIAYTETNCTYFNNSAGSYGGAWFVSLQRTKSKEPRVNFIGTSFEASSSLRKGGAVYIETGDVSLEDSSFTGSSAAEAGGDVYLVALASIAMTRVNSTASYSPQGSLLYAEATANEAMTLQNIQITNIPLSDVDTTVLMMNTGSLNMSDSVLENISSPLFQFTSSSATFRNISINNIHCETEKTAFCIFQGSGSTISAESFYISDVVSNQDLVLMKGSSSNFKVQNFNLTNVKKLRQNREYFALISKKINNTMIQDSSFSQLEFSGINVQSSRLQLANSIFSNAIGGRALQEDNSTSFLESSPASLEARFVVLDASNSSISSTDFIANSPNAITLNGGAIQITGNAGNHYFTGCSFEGNTGLNGGAVSIESAINSLTIENSEFINNIASRNGGSIHLAGQGSNVTPIISQTAFQRNEALVGGAIYVSKSPLRIQNSAFDNNTAQTGAAIVSLCSSSQKVSLSDSTFSLNNARIGASLMALGDLNFNTQTTTFSNNTAEYGGDISGRPHHLAMKVYRVSETFLYLNGVSVEYMLSHYQTVLIYDSQNASLRSPLEMKPGRIPSYIFEFGVQNEVNQIIPLKAMNLTLGSSLNDTASSSILGTLEHSFNQSTGFIFYAFYIRGNFGNTMTLPIQTIALDGFLNQTYTLPILGLPIIIKSCTVGELYDRTKLLCKPCSKDSFTFEDPFVAQSCQQCPDTAECLGGSVLYPKPGYWRISEASDNIVRCGSSDACLGGVTDDERNISLTGSCALGYEGIGCGTCSFGYIRGGLNNECVGCLASGIRVHMKYIAFFFIRAGIIFLTLGLFIIAHNRRAEGKEGGFKEILVIKVIIDFMHIINPILVLHKGWPDEVRDFFDIVSSVTALNRNNFSLDCLIALIRGKNDDVVFIKSAVLLLQPAFFVIFACIVALITAKITRSKIPDLVRNFVAMAVISAYICQPDTIQSLFTLFRCDNFGSTQEEEEFLLEDTNVRCWESHHAYWIIGIAIPALILWLLVPVVLLIRLIWKREYRGSESFIKKYDIILKNYQPQMFFWELVSLGRKLAFIVASMMRYYPYTQTYLGFSVLVTAYFFHKKFMPYSDHQINTAEMISIASSAGLMYTGLYYVHFMSDENMKPYINFLFAVNIVATVILIGYCTYIVRFMIKKTIRLLTKKCTKAIDAKSNKLKKPQAFDGENLLKPPRHGFPLLDLGRSPNLSNISFSPKNGATNMSSYRFKILSPKSTELQSPDAVLKTEPAVTATDEIEKIFTTKSRTLILESERNILSLFPSVGNSPVKNGLHSLSHENKSVKSVDALCLEIEGEAQDTDEHFVGPIVQKNRKKLIEQLERFKEDNNSSSFLSDETIPNVNMIKRSQFYGKGTGRANLK